MYAENITFITRKISIPHLMSQSTFGKPVILTSLCPPPSLYNDDLRIHNSVIYLGKDSYC